MISLIYGTSFTYVVKSYMPLELMERREWIVPQIPYADGETRLQVRRLLSILVCRTVVL